MLQPEFLLLLLLLLIAFGLSRGLSKLKVIKMVKVLNMSNAINVPKMLAMAK